MDDDFSEVVAGLAKEFGNKSANLIALDKICRSTIDDSVVVSVPNFCPISHETCLYHLNQYCPGWEEIWKSFVQSQEKHPKILTKDDLILLGNLRELIKTTFKDHPLADNVISDYLRSLEQGDLLMVRSTGKEDSQDLANPGGNISIAAVSPDSQTVSNAIGEVMASYFSEKSLQQRLKGGDDIRSTPLLPVLIQKMIGEKQNDDGNDAVVYSGVMYTGNNGTVIHGAYGHGELIVSGNQPYDSFYISAENVVYKEINLKPYRMAPIWSNDSENIQVMSGGLKLTKNRRSLQACSIPTSILWRLNKVGRDIEKAYGQPMDVEWVYKPKPKTIDEGNIYIVQARPIPKGDPANSIPSSVKSEKVNLLNKDEIAVVDDVISAAGEAARIITKIDQVLICDSIEEALDKYLKMDHPNIKAIIVKQPSAPNSHAAAQFNSVSIPVFRMKDEQIKKIIKLSNESSVCLVADPQRKQIFDARRFLLNSNSVEEQLFDASTGILSSGLFKSSMTAKVTVEVAPYINRSLSNHFDTNTEIDMAPYLSRDLKTLPLAVVPKSTKLGDLLHIIETASVFEASSAFQILMSKYYDLLDIKPETKLLSLESLHNALTIIESATSEHVIDSQKSLSGILNLLYKFSIMESKRNSSSNAFKILLAQSFAICLEISQILRSLEVVGTKKGEDQILRKRLLVLTNKLDGIIFNTGDVETRSSSLLQEFMEVKALKKVEAISLENTLEKEQRDYFLQFSKLAKFACNSTRSRQWISFVLECSKSPDQSKKLAVLMHYFVNKDMPAFLVNQMFGEHWDNIQITGNKVDKVLNKIFLASAKSIKNLNSLSFGRFQDILSKWEPRVSNWGIKDDFNILMTEFSSDMSEAFNFLSKIDLINIGALDKYFVLSEIYRLMEVIDNSIKALKSSDKYIADKKLHAERFSEMLKIYHRLMHMQISLMPDEVVRSYRANITNNYVTKDQILSGIDMIFEKLLNNVDERQLYQSGEFSVHSAVISSPACFERQFVQRPNLTLEDCFTLFHQNIIEANVYLGKELDLKQNDLPQSLQKVMEFFKQNVACSQSQKDPNPDQRYPAKMINILYKYPSINLNYNLPLAYHGAQFSIRWNVNTSQITIESKIYGQARDRFAKICQFSAAYNNLAGLHADKQPWFDEERLLLNTTFTLPPNTADAEIANACRVVLEMASMSFDTFRVSLLPYLELALKKLPNNEVENALKDLIDVCINDRHGFLELDEVESFLKLQGKISDENLKYLLKLSLTKVLNSEFKTDKGSNIYKQIIDLGVTQPRLYRKR